MKREVFSDSNTEATASAKMQDEFKGHCDVTHQNLQILKLKSKDITSKTLHAKFYASRIKNKRIRRGVKYASRVWSVFKSLGKIGLTDELNRGESKLVSPNCRFYTVEFRRRA